MIFKAATQKPTLIDYTYPNGRRSQELVNPISIEWRKNPWDDNESTWLLTAWSHRSKDNRTFLMKNIHQWDIPQPR